MVLKEYKVLQVHREIQDLKVQQDHKGHKDLQALKVDKVT